MLSRLLRHLWSAWAKPHLWRNPCTGCYHDPMVLYRALDALSERTATALRGPLLMVTPVTPDGGGWAETQVLDAYAAFVEWYEKKA